MDDADGYFGQRVAATYDDPFDPMFQPAAVDPAVNLLAELAGSGRALELAIGTGRIGLPLSHAAYPCTASSCPGRCWASSAANQVARPSR